MEVNAIARIKYNDDSLGWERLELIVKFREKGKLFKTKLNEDLATTENVYDLDNYEYVDFLNDCEMYISELELIKRIAKNMIKKYFTDKYETNEEDKKLLEIKKKLKTLDSIEIKVKID